MAARVVEGNSSSRRARVRHRREPLQSLHRRPPLEGALDAIARHGAKARRTSRSSASPAPGKCRSPSAASRRRSRSSTPSSRSPRSSAARPPLRLRRGRGREGRRRVSLARASPSRSASSRPTRSSKRSSARARRRATRAGTPRSPRSRWSRSSAPSTARVLDDGRAPFRPRGRAADALSARGVRGAGDARNRALLAQLRGRSRGRPYADESSRRGVAPRRRRQAHHRRLENWRLERMARVNRNLLRLGTWELMAKKDVPRAVILDEAVELAKSYGTEESSGFVNGVLDRIAERPRTPRRQVVMKIDLRFVAPDSGASTRRARRWWPAGSIATAAADGPRRALDWRLAGRLEPPREAGLPPRRGRRGARACRCGLACRSTSCSSPGSARARRSATRRSGRCSSA